MIVDWYETRRLKLLASEVQGHTVLDLGYAQLPNPFLEGGRWLVTGLDLDPPPADCRYQETLRGNVGDVPQLLGGRRFDTVIAGELIEHVENPYSFLRDIRTVLGPEGRLVLSTPNPLGFPVAFAEIIRDRRRFYSEDHTYYFLPRWVERMLQRTGYTTLRLRPVGLWLPGLRIPWVPVWLSYQVIYVARLS